MSKWLPVLLLAVLTAVSTEGWYTIKDIQSIVVHHAMPFWTFRREGHTQYGVLMLLPGAGKIQLIPTPGTLNSHGNGYTTYNKQNITRDTIVGFNYAAARTSERGDKHTETQLLRLLPEMLNGYYREYSRYPPAVLLYTRGTPCTDCTRAINHAGYKIYPVGQFVVAYTTNMVNRYQNLTINCENRKYLRHRKIGVVCVKEQYRKKQCIEDDYKVECNLHRKEFGW